MAQGPRWLALHFPKPERSTLPRACGATSVRGILPQSFIPTFMRPTRQSLGIGAPSLAFYELPLDVVFGDKAFNRLAHHLGHRHGFDQIVRRLSKSLSFRRISGHSGGRIRPSSLRWAQDHPDARHAGGEIV